MNTIAFPGLGIEPFEVNPVAFTLPIGDGIDIMWYALIITTGFIVAFLYACFRAKRNEGIVVDDLLDLMIFIILFGVLGARLYYVVMSPGEFDGFLDVINIRSGGLAIYGGLIAGICAIIGVCKVKKMNLWKVLDLVAPGVMIAQALGRWGNFMNAEAYGYEVAAGSPLYFLRMGLLPNMDSTVEMHYYHPTFLYESLWNILGFVLLNLFYKKKRYNGQIVLLYGVWYGFGRMWIEGLRTDSLYLGDTMIRVSQLVAFLSFAASLALLIVMWVRRKRGVEFENLCSFCTKTKATAVAGTGKIEGSNERTGEAEPTAPEGKETAERAEADTQPMGSEEKNEGVTENTEEQTEQAEKEQENG